MVAMQVETRITCPLSRMQTFWYRRLILKDSKLLKSLEAADQSVEVRNTPTWGVNTPSMGSSVHASRMLLSRCMERAATSGRAQGCSAFAGTRS